MNYFQHVFVDTACGHKPPAYKVEVAIGQSGREEWTKAEVMGHPCANSGEWDDMIDQLIKSLEKVRRAGHAKLAQNRRA